MKKEIFFGLIENIKYKEAKIEFEKLDALEQEKILFDYSNQKESLEALGFLDYLAINGWPERKILTWYIDHLVHALCFIDGAYGLGLYYTKKLCKLEPSVENLEKLFLFYEIPEKLLDDDMALKVAYEILKIDETHEYAQQIVTEIKQKQQALNILES